ncbi:MAG: hydrogenase [Gammaproteobacteria bacterium]|nr:hydrogenase [Gammaproteobacteria bacterium]
MTHPLIERLINEFDYPLLDADNYDEAVAGGTIALFFTEDPARFPETLDLAVVLPELVQAFEGRFTAAVVDRSLEKSLQQTFNFRVWPALVFLRDGQYLGALTRICDWQDYLLEIPEILDSKAGRNPGLGIPVVTEQRDAL